MSVVNGQVANQTTFNTAFVSRTAATTSTASKLSLLNVASTSIDDLQAFLNEVALTVGVTEDGDGTLVLNQDGRKYSSTHYVANGDRHTAAIGKIDTQLFTTQTDLDTAEATIVTHETRLVNIESNSMTIGGNKTFSGNIIVTGTMVINGATTYVNSTDMQVADKNVLLNKGGNDASADGGGIDVQRTADNGALRFDSALTSKWKAGTAAAMSEILVAALAQTITGAKTFSAAVNITDVTQSTTKDTGALIVEGGVGIEKNLNAGGNIAATGTILGSNLSGTHSGTSSGTNTGDASVGAFGAAPAANGMTIAAQILTLQPCDATNPGAISTGAQTIPGAKTFAAAVNVSDATQTGSIGTGSIITAGGISIAKTAYIGGNMDVGGFANFSGVIINQSAATFKEQVTPASPSATYRALYPKADGKWYSKDSAGVETTLGSGGAGIKNFITDGDAEAAVIGAMYADAAGVSPVDGTSGSPASTLALSSSSPGAGTNSFLLTKSAANRQGEGWGIPFTIDAIDKAKVLNINFKSIVKSGTFVAGTPTTASDVTVWIYDVTNGVVIQPSSYTLLSNSTTLWDNFNATFQTAYNSTSYRLCFHIGSTSALAYSLGIEDVQINRSTYASGTPVTDWVSWTPTGSWSTNTTYTGRKRRVGDTYEYNILVTATGLVTAAPLTVNIQETMDAAKLLGTALNVQNLGTANILDSGVALYGIGQVNYDSATSVRVRQNNGGTPSTTLDVSNTTPFTFNSSDTVNLIFSAPIVGLSSSVQMSDTNDQRLMVAKYFNNAGTSIASSGTLSVLDFATKSIDTHNAVTTGAAWKFTAPRYGVFDVSATILLNSYTGWAVTESVEMALYKNGVRDCTMDYSNQQASASGINMAFSGNSMIELNAGDYIDIRFQQLSGAAITLAAAGYCHVEVAQRANPAQIAASESVNASYGAGTAQSIGTGPTIINFDTKNDDSHGAFTTGASAKFTAPTSGMYDVSVAIHHAAVSTTWTANLYKNGADFRRLVQLPVATSGSQASGSTLIRLIAGDYIDMRMSSSSASTTLQGSVALTYISIKRVGN